MKSMNPGCSLCSRGASAIQWIWDVGCPAVIPSGLVRRLVRHSLGEGGSLARRRSRGISAWSRRPAIGMGPSDFDSGAAHPRFIDFKYIDFTLSAYGVRRHDAALGPQHVAARKARSCPRTPNAQFHGTMPFRLRSVSETGMRPTVRLPEIYYCTIGRQAIGFALV